MKGKKRGRTCFGNCPLGLLTGKGLANPSSRGTATLSLTPSARLKALASAALRFGRSSRVSLVVLQVGAISHSPLVLRPLHACFLVGPPTQCFPQQSARSGSPLLSQAHTAASPGLVPRFAADGHGRQSWLAATRPPLAPLTPFLLRAMGMSSWSSSHLSVQVLFDSSRPAGRLFSDLALPVRACGSAFVRRLLPAGFVPP